MLFTSYEFIMFAAILFVLYYLVPKKFQWMLLLLASYVFYSFAGIRYIAYILATTLSTWLASRMIGKLKDTQAEYLEKNKETLSREEKKAYKERTKKRQHLWLVLCMVFNFGILAVLKYSGSSCRM